MLWFIRHPPSPNFYFGFSGTSLLNFLSSWKLYILYGPWDSHYIVPEWWFGLCETMSLFIPPSPTCLSFIFSHRYYLHWCSFNYCHNPDKYQEYVSSKILSQASPLSLLFAFSAHESVSAYVKSPTLTLTFIFCQIDQEECFPSTILSQTPSLSSLPFLPPPHLETANGGDLIEWDHEWEPRSSSFQNSIQIYSIGWDDQWEPLCSHWWYRSCSLPAFVLCCSIWSFDR